MNEVSYISLMAKIYDKFPRFEWSSNWDILQDYPVILTTTLDTEDFEKDYSYYEGFQIRIIIRSTHRTSIEVYYSGKECNFRKKWLIKELHGISAEEVLNKLEMWVIRVFGKFRRNE